MVNIEGQGLQGACMEFFSSMEWKRYEDIIQQDDLMQEPRFRPEGTYPW